MRNSILKIIINSLYFLLIILASQSVVFSVETFKDNGNESERYYNVLLLFLLIMLIMMMAKIIIIIIFHILSTTYMIAR